MTLQRPELLLMGPAAALLLVLGLWLQWRRLDRLGRSLGGAAMSRLVPRNLQRFPTGRMLCLATAAFALAVAAAGPRPPTPEPLEPPPPLDLVVAVDVSLSMAAQDVAPSRIERAREVVDRLAESLTSARIVLVVFADWPYTLVPPTDDPALVQYFARSLSAGLVLDRDQGTSFSTALAHALAELDARSRPGSRRAVVLVSDGGAHEETGTILDAAASLSSEGVLVWTAGLGSTDGATIPTATGPLSDATGQAVLSRLDEDLLRDIARSGGGAYHNVGGGGGLGDLVEGLGGLGDDANEAGSERPDATFWLTLLAIPLLLAEAGWDAGRRGFARGEGTRA